MKISKYIILFLSIMFLWSGIQALLNIYPTYLWFQNLGFDSVFWITMLAKFKVAIVFSLLFIAIVGANVLLARRIGKGSRKLKKINFNTGFDSFFKQIRRNLGEEFGASNNNDNKPIIEVEELSPEEEKKHNLFWIAGITIFGIIIGLGTITQWEIFLKALNATSFNLADPIFNKDISFYMFTLPFYKFLQGFISFALFAALIGSIWIYINDRALGINLRGLQFGKGAKTHLALLLAIVMLVVACGIYLNIFDLLYSERGVVFGASFTDIHAQILGYNMEIYAAILTAILLIIFIFRGSLLLPISGIVIFLAVTLLMGSVYPAIIQSWRVNPNEITMEQPYIKHNIEFTRKGFGLDNVEEEKFAVKDNLSINKLNLNRKTIQNIRLLDPRPLKKTYRQLQEIRLYYEFADVDVTRYNLESGYRQVMSSPREMDVTQLPEKAQSWINQRLKYTHGYGLCLSPVNQITTGGLPNFFVKDIPPVSSEKDLNIDCPEIYYGEKTNNYVIVNTKEQEFDYPKGDSNVYTTYKGSGGVQINSLLGKLLFAIKFNDTKILLTGYIDGQSRVMFDRNIKKRVKQIAPFIAYDSDPYMVVNQGKLCWILDGYTLSNLFPYSEPAGQGYSKFNYIRNSVKVVIDAYDGMVDFYISDPKDPIIATYSKIFPKLFKPISEFPKGLKQHIRYPYDLFMVQAAKYSAYHMLDPQVFYNQEDLWSIPNENYAGSEQPMEAYYTIMRLPKEKKEEFLLMLPLTPNNKSNMIAWLAARCDGDNYGKLIVYKFPKDKLVYGPMQIEARIDQETEISKQLSLWGQKGSRVIRGNLLAIPIEESILYVEPLYLEASEGELPELKRVIVAYKDRIAMEETLNGALQNIFSGKIKTSSAVQTTAERVSGSLKSLADEALNLYNKALGSLKSGNWNSFGDRIENLGETLRRLKSRAK